MELRFSAYLELLLAHLHHGGVLRVGKEHACERELVCDESGDDGFHEWHPERNSIPSRGIVCTDHKCLDA